MNGVQHFEIPCDDTDRAIKFYEEVFDWKIQKVGGLDHDYWMVYTTEVDERHMPKKLCLINGGLYKRKPEVPKGTSIVVTVPSVEKHLEKIEEAGGKKVFGPGKVGDMGIYAQVLDSEGNLVGIWEEIK